MLSKANDDGVTSNDQINLNEKKRKKAPKGLSWRQNKLKKRKIRESQTLSELEQQRQSSQTEPEIDQSSIPTVSTGPRRTVSIAVPGSILNNAQSPELRSYLAGQIARAAAVFRVDEVIVFDETATLTAQQIESFYRNPAGLNDFSASQSCNFLLARILQYLETPQYLRKRLFPLQKELKYAGLLNPLDCPHHQRDDLTKSYAYREAVILDKSVKEKSMADAGLVKEVRIDKALQPGIRVTLKLDSTQAGQKRLSGRVVSALEASANTGAYWGYTVFKNCPLSLTGRYDVTIGTSDKGQPVESIDKDEFASYRHILIVFGGLGGLEVACEADERIPSVSNPGLLFDHYVNTCQKQGSRTIRTEEAILVSLASLRPYIDQ